LPFFGGYTIHFRLVAAAAPVVDARGTRGVKKLVKNGHCVV
jgi:hypothetical protein